MGAHLRLGMLLVFVPVVMGACRTEPVTVVTVTQSAKALSPAPSRPSPVVMASLPPQPPTPSPSPTSLLPETAPYYQPVVPLKPTPSPSVTPDSSASVSPLPSLIPSLSPSLLPSPAVSATPTQVPETVMVRIRNFSFVPGVVTIRQGGSVVFANDDAVSHSVVADGEAFVTTGVIQPQNFRSVTLAQVGNFGYRCGIHPGMTGQIQVVP